MNYALIDNKKILSVDKHTRYFDINWKMTLWCNYKCSYCFQEKLKLTPKEIIYDRAIKINQLINKLDCGCCLQLVGGEITFYDLKEIFSKYITSPNLKRITLITNFSRDVSYFNELGDFLKTKGVELFIVISYHEEYNQDYNKFFDKISQLNNNVRLSHLSVVLTNNNYQFIKDLFDNLDVSKYQYLLDRLQILKDQNGIDEEALETYLYLVNKYVNDIKKWIIQFDNGEELELNRSELLGKGLSFNGYMCNSILRIDLNGKVSCGTCGVGKLKTSSIDNLLTLSEKELLDFLKVRCIRRKCPLCGFNKIERN